MKPIDHPVGGLVAPAAELGVYQVQEDGFSVWHWVIASSEEDARAVWEEQQRDYGLDEAQIAERTVTAKRLSPSAAAAVEYVGHADEPKDMWAQFCRDPSRRHVACSEY